MKNREALERILVPIMRSRRTPDWIRRLERADVPVGKINSVSEALRLEVVRERKMLTRISHPVAGTLTMAGSPIKLTGCPAGKTSPPPLVGQHTLEVLAGLGFTTSQLATFSRKGII